VYIEVKGAHIAPRTRDGRSWGESEGAKPDPFAIVFVDRKELFRTPIDSNTLTPSWEGQPSGNYRIPRGAMFHVDLMDSRAMSNQAICSQQIRDLHEDLQLGLRDLDLRCDGGTRLLVKVGPARADVGLGFFYEIALGNINVTRLHSQSPAARAGLKKGDSIIEIMGKRADKMEDGEAQSLINANAQAGVKLLVERDGATKSLVIKQGPVYQLRKEFARPQPVNR
jgi:hypothetical protein